MTDNINELTHEDWDRIDDEVYKAIEEQLLNKVLYGYEVKMIITFNPASKPNPFYKKWLESINQCEVKWFISENALKEWEDTDDNK